MTTIITASTPERFLDLVPRLLGFTPRRSLVLVPFERGSSLGVMRLDLPAAAAPETDRIASDVIGLVCRVAEADGFAFVVYADAALHAGDGALPHEWLAGALLDRADACGLHVVHPLCVGSDAWGTYGHPRSAHPLPLPAAEPPGGAALPAPSGDQTSGARLPRVGEHERARVAQALSGVRTAVQLLHGDPVDGHGPGRIDPLAIAALGALDDLPEFYERCLAWDPAALDAYAAATLSWCLSRPAARDIALLGWTSGRDAGDLALDAQLRAEAGAPYPPALAMRMWGEGPRPDPERLQRALAVTRRVAAVTPKPSRAGALAVCGWLSWALGRSTHADLYARRALRLDRAHGLAGIVASFVSMGHLPDWAFRPAVT
jgi:hypothetical protein